MSTKRSCFDQIRTILEREDPAAHDDYYPEADSIWRHLGRCASYSEARQLVFEALTFWNETNFDEHKAAAAAESIWSAWERATKAPRA